MIQTDCKYKRYCKN